MDEDSRPKLEDVLHLLDSEIQAIESAEKRNGFNLWVIIAAIGGMLWLLGGELKTGFVDWRVVTVIILAGVLALDGIGWVYGAFENKTKEIDQTRFYWSHYYYGRNQVQIILEIARSLLIILMAFATHLFRWYFLLPLTICYSAFALVMTLVLVGSFKPLFVVSNNPNRWTYILQGIVSVSLLLALSVLLPLIPLPTEKVVTEFRIGGLVIGITYLLVMFARTLTSSLSIPILIDLRRRLVARKISPTNATHEAEIALGGMRVIDALRDEVANLLSLLDRMDEHTKNALMALEAIESRVKNPGYSQSGVASEQNTIASLTAGYRFFLNERQKLHNQHNLETPPLFKKIARIRTLPTANPSIDEILRMLESRALLVDENFKGVIQKEDEVRKLAQDNSAEEEKQKARLNAAAATTAS